MRPRICIRGNGRPVAARSRPSYGFNEAADLHPRKLTSGIVISLGFYGFNEAADLHPRKRPVRNSLLGNVAQTSLREAF